MSLTVGVRLCLLPAGTWALPLPGTLAEVFALHIPDRPHFHVASVLPPALLDMTPFTGVCAAWPAQVQPSSEENTQPRFSGMLTYQCGR